ncbi:hypothetical protein Pelo_1291 [Pelomyxa schiedti]|nr:hypothetical protein Pelo_1291 [Pelomyxa schiedti]
MSTTTAASPVHIASVGEPRQRMRDSCSTATLGFGYQNDVAVTMARGFMEDPLASALVTDPNTRRIFLWCFFTAYFPAWMTGRKTAVRRCFSRESPAIGDTKAATIWATSHLNFFQELWLVFTVACLVWWNIGIKGVFLVFRVISAVALSDECEVRIMGKGTKYMKLIAISTDPAMRNGGLGSLVIQPELDAADAQNIPCYLESSNLKNLTFYKRAGFETVETLKVFGVPVTLMKRPRVSERADQSH